MLSMRYALEGVWPVLAGEELGGIPCLVKKNL
jgi:hypothetical protein